MGRQWRLVSGSPPRVREEPVRGDSMTGAGRITPACAGRTFPFAFTPTFWRGSPPRVREEPYIKEKYYDVAGITPACAGRTRMVKMWQEACKDHPRVCGKNSPQASADAVLLGSPPRVREERFKMVCRNGHCRITPACAGRTPCGHCRVPTNQDHPRVCGKNRGQDLFLLDQRGSPPRVREEHGYMIRAGKYVRITPACAGRTIAVNNNKAVFWDHPRVCGKNRGNLRRHSGHTGSPPRVREELAF